MQKIAFITSRDYPRLDRGDRPLIEPLFRRGFHVYPAIWDDPAVAWGQFDAIIFRSCWDYHRRIDEFRTWLDQLEPMQLPLWNRLPLVRWNLDKIYLRDLAEWGARVVPTVWVHQACSLQAILQEQGWQKAVIKPSVSASAFSTWVTHANQAKNEQARFEAMLGHSGVLVQPLMETIAEGEWSLIFFNGIYSHAVLKRPPTGKIFVQASQGGSSETTPPPPVLIGQAAEVLRMATRRFGSALYARVDGLVQHGNLIVMELELIEPGLFLDYSPEGVERFADAITALTHEGQ